MNMSEKNISLKNVNWKQTLQTYLLIVVGTFIMSIGFVVFISPLKLAPGGVYGIAIILHHLFTHYYIRILSKHIKIEKRTKFNNR